MTQFQLALIAREVDGEVIHLRTKDGYINATAMCKSAGKLLADYTRLKTTQDFFDELSRDMGIPISELIQSFKGGRAENQGTWVHPDIAINLAQWLSPKFAVQVSRWVREWMSGERAPAELPIHLKRYMTNRGRVPHTHFSMLNELTLTWLRHLNRPDIRCQKKWSLIFQRVGFSRNGSVTTGGLSRRHSQHITMSTQMAGHSRYVYTQTNILQISNNTSTKCGCLSTLLNILLNETKGH